MIRTAAIALYCSLASAVLAGDFLLQSPVDCAIGEGERCYIQHYVDRDPTSGRRDFMCRESLTYDGHGGTDFALRSLADMRAGVAVLAAADGRVRAIREGVPDVEFDPTRDAERLDGRDCGNGVVIEHGEGWQTQYCHLRIGSIEVAPGENVAAGERLGLVGMSGRAQFPHLHLHVRKDGIALDPFAPDPTADCDDPQETIFATPPIYQPGGLISAGFATQVPTFDAIKAGSAHTAKLSSSASALVVWGFAYGTQPGDIVRLTITASDGTIIFQTDAEQDRMQAQMFRAGGRRTAGADWFLPGAYRGDVSLVRDGKAISNLRTQVTITSQ